MEEGLQHLKMSISSLFFGDKVSIKENYRVTHGRGINKRNINNSKFARTIYESQPQNLAKATREIKELLEQLEKNYPSETTTGRMKIATEVYEAAEPLFLQAIEIFKIALPENHPSLATSLNNLALLYDSQGKYEAAEPLLLQAMEINKIALPENHPSLAVDLNNLAGLYFSQGKYEAAEPLLLQAIEILRQSLGEEHPNTQTVLKSYQIFLKEKNESKSL